MADEVITVDGEDEVVSADTAKGFRGVKWALLSVFGFALIAAVIFVVFFVDAGSDGEIQNPAQIEQQRR